jgi:RNA polymerase primary sigma factor
MPPDTARSARDAARLRRLLRAAQRGDRFARERLVRSQLPMVRSIAACYQGLGLPLDDLVQEGAVGLLEAIDRFDSRRRVSFESYARFRIRRSVRNALTGKARVIRLPKQIVERRRALERAEARLSAAAGGRAPSPAELAAVTGLSVAAVLAAREAAVAPVSLDEPVLPDGSALASAIADPVAADPEALLLEHDRTAALNDALADLSERQRLLVGLRWGIGAGSTSNVDAARRLGLSARRMQAIQREALYKLRKQLEPERR